MELHELDWFKQRIGKLVYRTESKCPCEICNAVGKFGLIIQDELHANYLFDCQNELELFYSDTKE